MAAMCLAFGGACAKLERNPQTPEDEPVVEIRAQFWSAEVRGSVPLPDPLGTKTPEDEVPLRLSLDSDAGLGRPDTGVFEVDAAVMKTIGDEGERGGIRVRIRRGRWDGAIVTGDDLDLGPVLVPSGSPVRTDHLHEFYSVGAFGEVDAAGGLQWRGTAGLGISRNTTRVRLPQGTERTANGSGGVWAESELEYSPLDGGWVRARMGFLYFPLGNGAVDLEVAAGVRWAGLTATAGYQYSRVQGLEYLGPTIGLGIEF